MTEQDENERLGEPPAATDAAESRADRARKAQVEREEQRRARAAAKLRENLMRRKTQSRARRAGEADQTLGLPAAEVSSVKTAEEKTPAANSDESS